MRSMYPPPNPRNKRRKKSVGLGSGASAVVIFLVGLALALFLGGYLVFFLGLVSLIHCISAIVNNTPFSSVTLAWDIVRVFFLGEFVGFLIFWISTAIAGALVVD